MGKYQPRARRRVFPTFMGRCEEVGGGGMCEGSSGRDDD